MVLSHTSARFIIPPRYQFVVFYAKNSMRPTSTPSMFIQNFFDARNGTWIEADGNLKAQDQSCMLVVVTVRFLPINEFLSRLFVQYGVSCCKGTLFRLTPSKNFMNSFKLLGIKICIDCIPIWNKFPMDNTFKIPPDTQHYFGNEPIF